MTIEEVVATCHRGDWLLWLAERVDVERRLLVLAGALCANTVRHLMEDERTTRAVDVAIAYGAAWVAADAAAWAAGVAADAAARDASLLQTAAALAAKRSVGHFFFFLPQMLKRRTSALLPITAASKKCAPLKQ